MYRTRRLILERLSVENGLELLSYLNLNADHLQRWEPLRPPGYFEPERFMETVCHQVSEMEAGHAERLLLRDAAGGPVVGAINFSTISPEPFLACNLGYSLAAEAQGRGLMTEALSAALRVAFDTHGLHRIMANYMPANRRSAAVLRRLGFSVEGYARSYLKIAGRWEDHVLTALVSDDAGAPPFATA